MLLYRRTPSSPVRRAVTGAAIASLLTCVMAGTASAETKKIRDESGPALQRAANELVRGKVTYTATRSVWVAKVKRLSKRKTRVFGSIYYADGSSVKVFAKYRKGELVTSGRFFSSDGATLDVPVEATWDTRRDRVKITLDNVLADPKPLNRRAGFDVYTVTKGWMHGPHCAVTGTGAVTPCNDDYVFARLRR